MFNKTEKREKLQIANFNFVMGSLTMNASQPGIKIFPMLARDRNLKMMGEKRKTSIYQPYPGVRRGCVMKKAHNKARKTQQKCCENML